MTPTPPPPSAWHGLDRAMSRLREHRQPLSLAVDALVVAASWNATYLFRLGFERWWSARPGYDVWVMGGVVCVYLAVFRLVGVPRGMWRFSGFGEVKRLTLACLAAGAASAAGVLALQLKEVPRAVLALIALATWFVPGVRPCPPATVRPRSSMLRMSERSPRRR